MFKLEDQLGFNVNRVGVLFRRELIRCFKEYNLSPEQWQVLAALWEYEQLNQRQIMQLTLQDAPSVSKMITRMQKSELVVIAPSPGDKRAKLVSLTKKGRSLRGELPAKLLAHFDGLYEGFSAAKQKRLLGLLKELRQVMGDETSGF